MIDIQHRNGRPAALGAADKPRAVPAKMTMPFLAARMEQEDDVAGRLVWPRQVR
jgi:hypothetical protein